MMDLRFIIIILFMNRKNDPESEDPYDIIRMQRTVIEGLKEEIEEYKMICSSLIS